MCRPLCQYRHNLDASASPFCHQAFPEIPAPALGRFPTQLCRHGGLLLLHLLAFGSPDSVVNVVHGQHLVCHGEMFLVKTSSQHRREVALFSPADVTCPLSTPHSRGTRDVT